MRFGVILVAYFLIGATLWGGGVITWDNAGIGQLFIDDPETAGLNESTSEELSSVGGPIQEAAGTLGGGLIATWNLLVSVIGFMFWPVTALVAINAPSRIIVFAGGGLIAAFFAAVIRIFRGTA